MFLEGLTSSDPCCDGWTERSGRVNGASIDRNEERERPRNIAKLIAMRANDEQSNSEMTANTNTVKTSKRAIRNSPTKALPIAKHAIDEKLGSEFAADSNPVKTSKKDIMNSPSKVFLKLHRKEYATVMTRDTRSEPDTERCGQLTQ